MRGLLSPLIIVLYPVLFSFEKNRETIPANDFGLTILYALVLAVLALLTLRPLFHSAVRAGVVVSVVALFTLLYGPLVGALVGVAGRPGPAMC